MINYPLYFETKAITLPGIQTNWKSTISSNEISCAIPVEFSGPGIGLSPEDFYALAIQNCFIGTFKVFAEHSKLIYTELAFSSKLIVDKDQTSKPWMESIHLSVNIEGIEDQKKLNLLINKTLESGFILRSIKTKIITNINVNQKNN